MALAANIGSLLQAKYGEIQAYTSGAAIYRGATVVIKLGDGLAYPAVDDTSDVEKQLVVGVGQEQVDAAGKTIRVRQDGKWKRKLEGSPPDVIGRLACVKDDETVQLYDGAQCKVVVGRITEVSGTDVYVDFTDRPARLASGQYD